MADPSNFRRDRIEKLLHELEYEVTRGILEADIDEEMGFKFYVTMSRKKPGGVVLCEFRTLPIPAHSADLHNARPADELPTQEG